MDLKFFKELLDIIVWPLVVMVILFRFQKPLSEFIAGLGQRVTKLSAFDVSIELAALPEPPSPWTDPNIMDSSEMRGGEVSSTSLMMLFDHIKEDKEWEHLIIDVKDGHFWFVSRLFIFSVFLRAMRNLKCIVFVESSGKYRQRLLGVTSPDALRIELGQSFPWMEKALTTALDQNSPNFLGTNLPSDTAGYMVRSFIEDCDMRLQLDPETISNTVTAGQAPASQGSTDPVKPDEWLRLGDLNIWEHTHWLDFRIGKVSETVTTSFFEHDSSCYIESQDVTNEERTRALLLCMAPYVAVINSQHEFQKLIDRQKLAALVGEKSAKA